MVTLRVVLDAVLERSPRGIARYSEELTRALIDFAPRGCDVEGIVSAVPPEEIEVLKQSLPGVTEVHRTALGRRELRAAWQHGLTTLSLGGMIHAPTLLAPLARHDRRSTPGEQTVVTIHDASPWLFPDAGGPRSAWIRNMAKRARKYADAVVVPTHSVAELLSEHVDFGERLRVIGGAVSPRLALPADADDVADRLGLPDRYVVAVGTLDPRKNIEALFKAAARSAFPPDLQVLYVGESAWGERTVEAAIFESGAPEGRIRHIAPVPDDELAVIIDRAVAFVLPSLHEGFGLPAVEALHFATPLIHSDAPAVMEVVAGAGVPVELAGEDFAGRLADAIGATTENPALLERLSVEGHDRSKAFSWRDSAERVWQLHADL